MLKVWPTKKSLERLNNCLQRLRGRNQLDAVRDFWRMMYELSLGRTLGSCQNTMCRLSGGKSANSSRTLCNFLMGCVRHCYSILYQSLLNLISYGNKHFCCPGSSRGLNPQYGHNRLANLCAFSTNFPNTRTSVRYAAVEPRFRRGTQHH